MKEIGQSGEGGRSYAPLNPPMKMCAQNQNLLTVFFYIFIYLFFYDYFIFNGF